MEKMKTITIREKTWRKLMKFKINLGCQTIDEVVTRILGIITKFKLGEEMK